MFLNFNKNIKKHFYIYVCFCVRPAQRAYLHSELPYQKIPWLNHMVEPW